MTQYFLSVHHDEAGEAVMAAMTPDDMQRLFTQVEAFNTRLRAEGAWVFAGGLEPPTTATVVDATGSEVLTTDGPFAETKEQLGGFWVVEAPDLDAALEIARRGSQACMGPVEVRPFQGA